MDDPVLCQQTPNDRAQLRSCQWQWILGEHARPITMLPQDSSTELLVAENSVWHLVSVTRNNQIQVFMCPGMSMKCKMAMMESNKDECKVPRACIMITCACNTKS